MHVLLAPGSFGGTASAVVAARALAAGWSARSAVPVTTVAMSDGATDLVEVVAEARGGRIEYVTVPGPLGDPAPAAVLVLDGPAGGTAVVAADHAIGSHLVAPQDRVRAVTHGGSHGVGVLIRAALGTGASRVVVGVGQGAVHDAGVGMLEALAPGSVPPSAGGVRAVGALRAGDLCPYRDLGEVVGGRDVVVACAVEDPLLGLHGAGAHLAARTGMSSADAQEIERAVGGAAEEMERWADAGPRSGALTLAGSVGVRPRRRAGLPRSGAGGGIAFALGLLGARLVDGAAMVADLVELETAIQRSRLVVTGGARLMASDLHSGVVARVGEVARRHAVPVVAVAPRVGVSRRELAGIGVVGAYATDPEPGPFAAPAVEPASERDRLERLGARLARTWAPPTR